MRFYQGVSQPRQIGFVLFLDDQLVWICPAIGADRHGFAAPNQFRAALATAGPSAQNLVCESASSRSVPAFHRLHGETVADFLAVDRRAFHGCIQRGERSGEDLIVAWEI